MHISSLFRLLLAAAILLAPTLDAPACSRVLWNTSPLGVLVGRNMDWFEDLRSNVWALPAGMERSGLTAVNPLRWTSKHGSLAITAYECGTTDGLNTAGLAVHLLYLPECSTKPRDPAIPGMAMSLWAQYYLDNFATVAEAVASHQSRPFQLQMSVEPTSGKPLTIHLALDDPTGDLAVLECIDGEIKIYHDRRHTVMTNQPTFDKQLENLKRYRGFGGDQRLPGTHEPSDRFTRGAYYVANLPTPKTKREAIASIMSVMRNVSAPFGEADPERPNVSTTIWRTVTDLSEGVLYYDSVVSPQVFWVEIAKLNLSAGQPVRKLTVVDNYELTKEVSGEFVEAPMFEFLGPE